MQGKGWGKGWGGVGADLDDSIPLSQALSTRRGG